MSGDITPYTDKITSEHDDKPKFFQVVSTSCQPSADLSSIYDLIPGLYDVDVAVGSQLDVVGQWVGVSRNLETPLAGVYFSFDTLLLGFDEGIWKGPFDPDTGITVLPDEFYRLVIKARILNNAWNGSTEDAYTLSNLVFSALGYQIYIEDPSNLTMRLGLIGPGPPAPIVQSLLVSGKLDIKPICVRISEYFYQSAEGPIFAFDINDGTLFGGLDMGSWAIVIPT